MDVNIREGIVEKRVMFCSVRGAEKVVRRAGSRFARL